jgi:hypothetical protein
MCCVNLRSCFKSILSCFKAKDSPSNIDYSAMILDLNINQCHQKDFYNFFIDLLGYKVIFESKDKNEVVFYNPKFSKNLFIHIKLTDLILKPFSSEQQLIFYLEDGFNETCSLLEENNIKQVEIIGVFLKINKAKMFVFANNFRVIFFPKENVSDGKKYKMRICSHGLDLNKVSSDFERINFTKIDSFRQPDGYAGDMYAPSLGDFDCHIEFTQSLYEKSDECLTCYVPANHPHFRVGKSHLAPAQRAG